MTTEACRGASASNEGLGLAPKRAVVAYLYHDAQTAEETHPWLHSTMLVLAADRRPNLRNETPLVTLAQAEAMVAAERERCAKLCDVSADVHWGAWDEHADPTDQGAAMEAERLASEIRGPNARLTGAQRLHGGNDE